MAQYEHEVQELMSEKIELVQKVEARERQLVELEEHVKQQEKKYLNQLKVYILSFWWLGQFELLQKACNLQETRALCIAVGVLWYTKIILTAAKRGKTVICLSTRVRQTHENAYARTRDWEWLVGFLLNSDV